MLWIEPARLLLRKAQQDLVIVSRAADDFEIADEIVGFHVQQATEKCLKSVLAARGIAYRRTHDLQELYDLLEDSGVNVPGVALDLVAWSPFAVAYRYEDWFATHPVDRARAVDLVRALIAWVQSELAQMNPGG